MFLCSFPLYLYLSLLQSSFQTKTLPSSFRNFLNNKKKRQRLFFFSKLSCFRERERDCCCCSSKLLFQRIKMCPNVDSTDKAAEAIKKQSPTKPVINLDHGDPTMYVDYWSKMGDKSSILISGCQSLSYFSDIGNLCWFLEPEFAEEVKRLHSFVGNAVTEDRHIVVGTGSTQLFQAALYALSSPDSSEPTSVVCAVPYYSSYPTVTDYLKSGLYKWAGDANTFDKEGPYIELVCSPNNPDGFISEPVVKNRNEEGSLVHDLAYYWPQYTAITAPADHDIMLFTVSKSTGHAGTRIGWALVKDELVARKMTKFIELNTIGVSKDSQLRAAKILRAVTESGPCPGSEETENFFEYARRNMIKRWEMLRAAIEPNDLFTVPEYKEEFCNFFGDLTEAHPAFAWVKSNEDVENCQSLFESEKVLVRSGVHFGMDPKHVRVSMVDLDENFNIFIERLSSISSMYKK